MPHTIRNGSEDFDERKHGIDALDATRDHDHMTRWEPLSFGDRALIISSLAGALAVYAAITWWWL